MDPMGDSRLEGGKPKKYQHHLEQLPQVKSLKMTVFLMEHFLQGVQFCWQMQIQTVNELKFIEQH